MPIAGKKISDESTLVDLGVHPNGTIQIQVHSNDPVNHPIEAFRPRQEYHMPDVITVRISTGQICSLIVEGCNMHRIYIFYMYGIYYAYMYVYNIACDNYLA